MFQGIEDSVKTDFGLFLQEEALRRGATLRAFPLNAQDRDAAGDVIFSDETRLSLIEFKSYENNLKDENRKPKRAKLCELLFSEDKMRSYHDRCHFACWRLKDSLCLNVYRHEICNRCIFADLSMLPAQNHQQSRFWIDDYAESFYTANAVSLSLDEFEEYLAWVMTETSGSEKSTVSVQARNHTVRKYTTIDFTSLRKAHEWFSAHKPRPRLGPRPTPRSLG